MCHSLNAAGLVFMLAAGIATAENLPAAAGEMDSIRLIEQLRHLGGRVEDAGEIEQPFLAVPGQLIRINGEEIQVFQYPYASDVALLEARISPDGRTIGTSKPLWLAPPHFFRMDKVLVLYLGDNRSILSLLASVLGSPFAGQ